MSYTLGKRSRQRLEGVHPDLVRIVERAIEITDVDFMVLEGLRTVERQEELFSSGASRTMNSRHLTGHAVDLGAYVASSVRWDWPLYHKIADAMKQAANELNIPIQWGGDWSSFKDGPHFQLPHSDYPVIVKVKEAA
ncbi:endolysin [gamma proteobacterium IMCC1989]|nr:endolysin [gamma proteobacterium IMCC1989]